MASGTREPDIASWAERVSALPGTPLVADLPDLLRYITKWTLLVAPLGVAVGSACALFLWSLEKVTAMRWEQPWLLYLLPVAGVLVGLMYHWLGRSVEGGSNLIVDEIHEPGGGIPARIAPLVFIGTIVTHICGGSAGREGTAVQMGGGIASAFARMFRFLTPADTRTLLMTGVAGGFGGVFGTPLAGTVFAMEVLAIGRMSYEAILPCLIAAIVADWTCGAWSVGHTPYHIAAFGGAGGAAALHLDWVLLAKVAVAGAAFGLTARLFAELAHGAQHVFKRFIKAPYLRPAVGGVGVIGLAWMFGSDYLGIGVTNPDPGVVTIVSSFHEGGAQTWSWLLKIVFTVMTLSSGFKGGEVTPLFYIGASLGNVLAGPLHAPTDLMAGLGFVAVFAAAANTPLACTIMAVELFGVGIGPHVVYFAVACFTAYFFGGHAGIYLSQRIATPKLHNHDLPDPSLPAADLSLRDAMSARAPNRRVSTQLSRNGVAAAFAGSESNGSASTANGVEAMKVHRQHKVVGREVGQLRIYLNAAIKGKPVKGWRRLLGWSPLYRDLIAAAKADGILHATAHNTFHGYSGKQPIQSDNVETGNPRLTLCVELVDTRAKLEAFVKHHGDLLKDRVMVYKHVEHWHLHDHTLDEHDATPEELEAESAAEDV